MLNKILAYFYERLVKGNEQITYFYTLAKYQHQQLYRHFRFILWFYFLWLLVKYRLFKVHKYKKLPVFESDFKVYPALTDIQKKLVDVDVISFDVFDTLLLRRVASPEDVFELIGKKLNTINYRSRRIFAESEARRRSVNGEVTLEDICKVIEEFFNIEATKAYDAELQAEREVCFANPYFVDLLRNQNLSTKQIIVVSDMYLPSSFINELLSSNCFHINKVYVSCEYDCSKADGKLWAIVKADFSSKKMLHIGDNYISDMKMCGKAGIDFIGVPNISWAYSPYRQCGVHSLVMSVYSAHINNSLHTRNNDFSKYYEHGYIYGGLLSYGYCSWLEKLSKEREYDLLLFTARDSKVFYDLYNKYFGGVKAAYLYTSRFAALKITIRNNYDMFLDIMFRSKARCKDKISLGSALEQADIGFMMAGLNEVGLSKDTVLDEQTVDWLIAYLIERKQQVIAAYEEDRIAFDSYVSPIIGDAKKICVIDLGWRGTVFSLLHDYFIENNKDINLEGAMLGTSDSKISNDLIESGKLHSYAFSNKHNINFMVDEKKIVMLEVLYSSSEPSVKGYRISAGIGVPVFEAGDKVNSNYFEDMHRGIYDFCAEFNTKLNYVLDTMCISGAEAIGAIHFISNKAEYTRMLFKNIKFSLEPNAKKINIDKFLIQ